MRPARVFGATCGLTGVELFIFVTIVVKKGAECSASQNHDTRCNQRHSDRGPARQAAEQDNLQAFLRSGDFLLVPNT